MISVHFLILFYSMAIGLVYFFSFSFLFLGEGVTCLNSLKKLLYLFPKSFDPSSVNKAIISNRRISTFAISGSVFLMFLKALLIWKREDQELIFLHSPLPSPCSLPPSILNPDSFSLKPWLNGQTFSSSIVLVTQNVWWLKGQTVFDQTLDNGKPFKCKVERGS